MFEAEKHELLEAYFLAVVANMLSALFGLLLDKKCSQPCREQRRSEAAPLTTALLSVRTMVRAMVLIVTGVSSMRRTLTCFTSCDMNYELWD